MNRSDALALARESARTVVPGPDADGIAADAPLREALEMDSLDFLEFVEVLGKKSGARIGEPDYADAVTLGDFADIVVALTGG